MEELSKTGASEVFYGDQGFQGNFGGVSRVWWDREEMGNMVGGRGNG